MITNGDENMADVLEDWEHAEDEGPDFNFDLKEYDQFLLKNPKAKE